MIKFPKSLTNDIAFGGPFLSPDDSFICPYMVISDGGINDMTINTTRSAVDFYIIETSYEGADTHKDYRDVAVGGWYIGPGGYAKFSTEKFYSQKLPPPFPNLHYSPDWCPTYKPSYDEYSYKNKLTCCCCFIDSGTLTGSSVSGFGGNLFVNADVNLNQILCSQNIAWDEYNANYAIDEQVSIFHKSWRCNIFHNSRVNINRIDLFEIPNNYHFQSMWFDMSIFSIFNGTKFTADVVNYFSTSTDYVPPQVP